MTPHRTSYTVHRTSLLPLLLVFALFLSACGDAKKEQDGDLNDKRVQLQKLKAEQRTLDTQIDSLEAQIARLDPAAANRGAAKLVALDSVSTGSFEHFIDLQGRLDANNISYVSPRGQGGVVTALYVQQGDNVRKGQVLAKVDDRLIRDQIAPLRVQLAAADDTYRRTKNLWDQGIGTYQQVLSAQTQAQTLRRQIDILQQQIAYTNITAPASGVAEQVNIRVGEVFAPQTAAMSGIRIVNTGSLKVVAQVPENYIGRVKEGTPVQVYFPDGNRTVEGRVNVASQVVDPATRGFYIEVKVPGSGNLKPGQVAIVKVRDYATSEAVTIPLSLLQNDASGKFVMVAVREGDRLVARKRTVVSGELYGDRLEVKSGLQPGDILITEGYQGLYDGQTVKTSN